MLQVRAPFGRRGPWRLGLVFLLAALLGWSTPAAAQASDPRYRVSGVEVEATAQDAVAARTLAIEQGQRRAFERLLQRLASEGAAVGELRQAPLEDLVASLEVVEETVGPTSYAATLEVAFDRAAVAEFLDERGVAFAAAPADPIVVVPLWETGSGLRLWGSDNAWRTAWDRAVDAEALVPFVVPLGDLQDLALLNPDQAARGDAAALRDLAARYDADAAVVARLQGSGEPGSRLEIAARRYGDDGGEPYRAVVRRAPDEDLATSLERAVGEMQAAFDARYREQRVAAGRATEALVVTAAVDGIDGWGRLMRLLDRIREVERAQVRTFSHREATLELEVAGGAERLRSVLGEQGWRLRAGESGRWQLEPGAAPGGTAPL